MDENIEDSMQEQECNEEYECDYYQEEGEEYG